MKVFRYVILVIFGGQFLAASRTTAEKILIIQALPAETKISLSQSDFDSGTYRITSKGYYQLDENILFNPKPELEKQRSDKPFSGWFASITVETSEPVIIDLNGLTLASSEQFDEKHLFNVFAQIELDNCPFSGKLFGFPNPHQAFVNFKGDTIYKSASNVIIKNGVLGRSGHWGIHGNNNSNIYIENIIIKDWEVRGIELNGLVGGVIQNVEISGLEHMINTSVPLVGVLQVQETLKKFSTQGYKDAELYYHELSDFLTHNPRVLNPPQEFPIGTIGGIFIAGGGVSNVDFPVTANLCSHAIAMTGGRTVENVDIENVIIHDLVVNSVQLAAIGSNCDEPNGQIIRVEEVGLLPGGSLLWKDAFNEKGEFEPNSPLRATIFVMQAHLKHNPSLANKLPANFGKIAQSILEKDHLLFLSNVKPIYTYPSHKIKGLFGVRIEGAQNVHLNNCHVKNIKNIGANVAEFYELPDGKHYRMHTYKEYRGNDIWAFECAASKECSFVQCTADTIISHNGNPFGFELIADTDLIALKDCHVSNIFSYGDTLFSSINLPSESYGFRVKDTVGKNFFLNCTAMNITAPRRSFGFAAERCKNTIFDFCEASNVDSWSDKLSLEREKLKVAFGFNAESSQWTSFQNCNAEYISINGQKQPFSSSIAAGFAFNEGDTNSHISNYTVSNIHNPFGNAFAVYVDEESDRPVQKNN